MLKIFGAPYRYVQGSDALQMLGQYARWLGQRAILVIDSYVHAQYGSRIEALCVASQIQLRTLIVQGDLTPQLIASLSEQGGQSAADMVIAAGGGKALDAGKGVAKALNKPVITVPTVASNDAPTSKNYVLYDEHHNLLAVEHMRFNPALVLVDTTVVASAPRPFFLAGLGDAISKKFEAEQCFARLGKNMYDGHSTLTAQAIAESCLRTLLQDAEQALLVAGTGQPTPAFERTVEAMILMSGLGFESGGLSIAHALTRGLPKIPGLATSPHGLQVAVGLLVQLDLEQRADSSLDTLRDWYGRVGLPTTLRDIGARAPTEAELTAAAELTLAARHTANFQRPLDPATLVAALYRHL